MHGVPKIQSRINYFMSMIDAKADNLYSTKSSTIEEKTNCVNIAISTQTRDCSHLGIRSHSSGTSAIILTVRSGNNSRLTLNLCE